MMRRLILALGVLGTFGLAAVAMAGDYHSGVNLICSDCHIAHYSQQHGYTVGGPVTAYANGPNAALLRNKVNELCLTCHNDNPLYPDVFGTNNGNSANPRRAGGLNAASTDPVYDAAYPTIGGHTLWSKDLPPGTDGKYVPRADGLECVDCHSQHGQNAFMFRNLQYSTTSTNKFYNKTVSYAVGTNDLTKDVFESVALNYDDNNINYNEPDQTKSAMGNWCGSCHTDFHGAGGAGNMGGQSGGWTSLSPVDWIRHPTADVNIGHAGSTTRVSSLAQFAGHTNKVKVMDNMGIWDGTDNTVTPSCMSCHKSHGNMNGFGLIFMNGTGTPGEEGDGGVYKDLCRQCHIQGA